MLRQLCLIISGAICTDMLRKNRLGYYHASFCLAVVVFLIIFQMDSAVFLPDWGYASRDINEVQQLPPTKWSDRYPRCNGTRQSPISINSSTAQADGSLTEVGYYNYAARAVDDLWTIANTGHVVLFSGNFKNTPGIHSAGLSIPYFFQQMHFHWGAVNNRGSEHVIDGRRYPLELHIVHRSHDEMEHWQPYDITSSSDSIGTAVIAVMFELAQEGDEKNEHLDRLFHALAAATLIDSAPINISLPELTLFDLLPQHQSYYRYIGSLTTPPCAEAVIWTVMEQPLKVTEEQLEIFRHLRETVEYYPPVEHVDVVAKKSERDVEIVDNFRPLQDLNKRIVTHFAVATSNPPEAETVSKGHRYRLKGRNSGVLLIVLVFCIITRYI
ncbi:carbonic anhydrase 7-like [Paramacrobiotus metropolitanus]|uniref:carbonic anhydrase 7-like n=1 Tax=Paramacrobiotus metropolitanus TaxID=2943436 RepID=UPI0024465554|nr:carbonic anhydrase 7-like [Paramacrobiotus metropolitanus]